MTNTLCDATCGNVVYVRRNAAFTLRLGHVTGGMKQRESNETHLPTLYRRTAPCTGLTKFTQLHVVTSQFVMFIPGNDDSRQVTIFHM